MRKRLLIFVLLLAAPVSAAEFRRAETLEDAFAASCRVSVANARGTGTFIGVDEEKRRAVILTNYHVVTSATSCTLDFWTNSKQESVKGEVFARFYDARRPADFALIAVDPDELARINPPFVALAGADAAPAENSFIMSAGCPKGRFVQAWKGHTLNYYNGATIQFKPGPVPGQSGSGVLSVVDGQLWLTAVLTWLIGTEGADDSTGGAIPISNLYASLTGYRAAVDASDPIPPGAKECGESVQLPCVLFFSQKNCPPCLLAKNDAETLERLGARVYTYDVDTQQGGELCKRFNVRETPVFIVLDENNRAAETYTGAGHALAIWSTLENLARRAPSVMGVPASVSPSGVVGSTSSGDAVTGAGDFRTRPAIYQISDAGFFEDSDKRWRERLAPKTTPRDDQSDEDDDQNAAPTIPTRPKIGDATASAIGKMIEKTIDKKASELAATIAARAAAMKYRLLMAFCVLLAVALIIAEGLAALTRSLWRRVRAKLAAALLAAAGTTIETKERNDNETE